MMKKVSIITVSYNSAKTIRETIESVINQNYPNIEYLIYDGNSTDGTQSIIQSYGSKIAKFVSEKDNGLYDAMNKAIDASTGDIVAIINSDDIYADNDVIGTVVKEFETKHVDTIFGDLSYFETGKPDKVVRYYRGSSFRPSRVKFGVLPPHPTFFVKRELYQRYGKFDLQYKYASDFDLMARLLCVHRVSYSYLPLILVKMRLGGISTGSIKGIIALNKEDIASCGKNGIKTNFFMFHLKYLFKVFHIRDISALLRKSK